MRKLALLSVVALIASFSFLGCAGEDVGACNCPDIAPFGVPGSDNCYADPFQCELEEGQPCEQCN